MTPVTSRWGNVTVAGPRAWDWLKSVGFDPVLAPGSMRHMTIRDCALDGVDRTGEIGDDTVAGTHCVPIRMR